MHHQTTTESTPKPASRAQWLAARQALLIKEKQLTRAYEELARQRRELPWVPVEKTYTFDAPSGKVTLQDLFDRRSQLIVNHFMFGPGWKEGCVGCSFGADHIEGALVHLNHHDVTYVAVSRAPIEEIEAFRKRMGWTFPWVSSAESDFNFDFDVSFAGPDPATGKVYYNYEWREFGSEEGSGLSVFVKDKHGKVNHTYSCYARGAELALSTYVHLDLTPYGRNENGPNRSLADWVRHHDRYGKGGTVNKQGRYVSGEGEGRPACGCESSTPSANTNSE